MPPMNLMCSSFLQSLIVANKPDEVEKMVVESDEGLAESPSSSSDEDDDLVSKKSPKTKRKVSSEKTDKTDELSTAEKLSIFFKDLEQDSEFMFDDNKVSQREEKFFFDGI